MRVLRDIVEPTALRSDLILFFKVFGAPTLAARLLAAVVVAVVWMRNCFSQATKD